MAAPSRAGMVSLSGRHPDGYRPHPLHGPGTSYPETNCYTDVLIELLHATGHEPTAMLGHLVRMDFEGDQWTFFKPPPEDLERLYGIDVHEMQPYRPLPQQIGEQIERGRTIIVELDSWYLPDTASTSYRTAHVKTSVAADAIDLETRRFRYFHNAGLWELAGDDFTGAFDTGGDDVVRLPPYTELVRFDAGEALPEEELRRAAVEILSRHMERVPQLNPFERFGSSLEGSLPILLDSDLDTFHAYAFATVRMVGSAFELAAAHARWLFGRDAEPAAAAMDEIVTGCKALSFRLARRRAFDPGLQLASLSDAWARALSGLSAHIP